MKYKLFGHQSSLQQPILKAQPSLVCTWNVAPMGPDLSLEGLLRVLSFLTQRVYFVQLKHHSLCPFHRQIDKSRHMAGQKDPSSRLAPWQTLDTLAPCIQTPAEKASHHISARCRHPLQTHLVFYQSSTWPLLWWRLRSQAGRLWSLLVAGLLGRTLSHCCPPPLGRGRAGSGKEELGRKRVAGYNVTLSWRKILEAGAPLAFVIHMTCKLWQLLLFH